MPSRSAARHSSARSPDGSAAASCSSRRVWAGRASSWRPKLASIRPVSGVTAGRPNPPASSAGVSPRGSSSSASGLPRVSAMIRSRTRASSGPARAESSSARAWSVLQPCYHQLGLPGQFGARIAGREHQRDRVGGQPPRHEPERLLRGLVQPLLVVDQADQRLVSGHLGEQAEHGQPDQEPVRRRARGQAERGPQRIALRHRDPVEVIQHRGAQLMQPGEGQLHLRLHAGRPRYPASARPFGQVVQQHRLAHARVAAHHQHPALAGPDRVDQPVQHVALAVAVGQPRRTTRPLRCRVWVHPSIVTYR